MEIVEIPKGIRIESLLLINEQYSTQRWFKNGISILEILKLGRIAKDGNITEMAVSFVKTLT